MHADGARLFSSDGAELLRVGGVSSGAEGHSVGKCRDGTHAGRQPALEIGGNQQRESGVALQLVGDRRHFKGRVLQQDRTIYMDGEHNGTDVVLLYLGAEFLVSWGIEVL